MGGGAPAREIVGSVWDRQSVWSQTANRLKARIDRLRSAMLALAVASAILTTLAAQVESLTEPLGKALAVLAGVSVGLVPVVRSRLGRDAVSRWTRARAVSEELKAEVFQYLADVAPYRGGDGGEQLLARTRTVEDEAADLLVDTADVEPVQREAPAVHDFATYVEHRVDPQIRWYRSRSAGLKRRLARARFVELGLGVLGVLLAAVAAAGELDALAAWIAVVTTLTAALSSHVAASRWEYQLVEYLRTAAELSRLRDEWSVAGALDEAAEDRFVERCEHVVSIQNDGWMAKWAADLS
jgi:hypothetical protein